MDESDIGDQRAEKWIERGTEKENERIVRGERWVHNSLFITDDHRVGNLGGGLIVSGAASVLVKSVVYAAGIVKKVWMMLSKRMTTLLLL